jgi:hypothetical protein
MGNVYCEDLFKCLKKECQKKQNIVAFTKKTSSAFYKLLVRQLTDCLYNVEDLKFTNLGKTFPEDMGEKYKSCTLKRKHHKPSWYIFSF